jgi:hypothetical protein
MMTMSPPPLVHLHSESSSLASSSSSLAFSKEVSPWNGAPCERSLYALGERVLFIGTQFSILYTSMYSPAEAATPRA